MPANAFRRCMRLLGAWGWLGVAVVLPTPASALTWETYTQAEGLPSNRVLCLAENRERIFAGTEKGLAVIEKGTRAINVYAVGQGLPHDRVLTLLRDEETIWIGTEAGLACWQAGKVSLADPAAPHYRVHALLKRDNELYLGTDQGVQVYLPDKKTTRPCEGLQALPITALARDDSGLLIGLSNGQIQAYNFKTKTIQQLALPFNPLHSRIKAFASKGDYIWFVMDGAGVVQFNKATRSWDELSRTSATGKFLSGLAPDGGYLWIASFYGLHRYNLATRTWEEYTDPRLTSEELTGIAIFGEWITVGTDGGGLLRANKRLPHLDVEFDQRLFQNEVAVFRGRAQGTPPAKVRLQYSMTAFPDIWFEQFASSSLQGEVLTGRMDFSRLVDNHYQVRVTLTNAAGASNAVQFTWVKDSLPLKLTLVDRQQWWPGKNTVEGMYQNPSIREIVLYPGRVKAELDAIQRVFRAQLMLQPGDREIVAEVLDVGGRTQRFALPVKISAGPALALQTESEAFLPGAGKVVMTLASEVIQGPVAWEMRIQNQDGIVLQHYRGQGPLPVRQTWDGKDDQKELVDGGLRYFIVGKVQLPGGKELSSSPVQVQAQLQVTKVATRKVIKLAGSFLFEKGKADIKPDYLYIFDEVARLLAEYPKASIVVEGHTDGTPIHTTRYPTNLQLSEERALVVMEYLARHCGLARERIRAEGFGKSRPLTSNATEAGRSRNRRVEIVIQE